MCASPFWGTGPAHAAEAARRLDELRASLSPEARAQLDRAWEENARGVAAARRSLARPSRANGWDAGDLLLLGAAAGIFDRSVDAGGAGAGGTDMGGLD